MAGGELIVSIFSDSIVMELFQMKGKKKTLIRKHFENYSVPLSDLNKVDAMDIEKVIGTFLSKDKINRGKINLVVFGSKSIMDYYEVDVETTKKKEIKNMIPIEIENLGEEYVTDYHYRYDVLGSKVKIYFLKKNIVEHLSGMKFNGAWELDSIIPGYITYQGMVPGDGVVLDILKDTYTIYGFRNGYINDVETGSIYTEFSIDRPVNPSPDELFNQVVEDVKLYVSNYNFKEGVEVDLVNVVFNDNVEGDFEPRDIDGIHFEKVRDLREWMDVIQGPDVFEDDNKDTNCKRFEYSSVALGLTYLSKDIYKYNFSPEKLGILYKNVLVTSLSFSIMLMAALPSVSILTDTQLEASKSEVKSYESNIVKYEEMIKGLAGQVADEDQKIQDYNAYVSSLESLSNVDRNFISGVMQYLPENTPSSILVQEIRLTKGTKDLVLKGVSQNYKDIGAFAIQLEKFGRVDIKDIENNELMNVGGYPFEIKLKSF